MTYCIVSININAILRIPALKLVPITWDQFQNSLRRCRRVETKLAPKNVSTGGLWRFTGGLQYSDFTGVCCWTVKQWNVGRVTVFKIFCTKL